MSTQDPPGEEKSRRILQWNVMMRPRWLCSDGQLQRLAGVQDWLEEAWSELQPDVCVFQELFDAACRAQLDAWFAAAPRCWHVAEPLGGSTAKGWLDWRMADGVRIYSREEPVAVSFLEFPASSKRLLYSRSLRNGATLVLWPRWRLACAHLEMDEPWPQVAFLERALRRAGSALSPQRSPWWVCCDWNICVRAHADLFEQRWALPTWTGEGPPGGTLAPPSAQLRGRDCAPSDDDEPPTWIDAVLRLRAEDEEARPAPGAARARVFAPQGDEAAVVANCAWCWPAICGVFTSQELSDHHAVLTEISVK